MARVSGRATLRVGMPALLSLLMVGGVSAQVVERGAFVVVRGADTLAAESYERGPLTLTGTLLVRIGGQRLGYRMDMTAAGLVTRAEVAVWPATAPDTAAPMQRGTITFSGDTAFLQGAGSRKVGIKPGTLPYLNLSGAGLEAIVRRSRESGSSAVPLVTGDGATVVATVNLLGTDSAVMTIGGVDIRMAIGRDGRLLSATVPAQGVRFLRVEKVSVGPLAPTNYSAPAGAPYVADSVTVQGPDGPLVGTLTLPKARNGRIPAVVTITGSGPEDRDEAIPMVVGYRPFRQVADTLSRRGIAVLRLDDRGTGQSAGKFGSATSLDFAKDIEAGVAYLRGRPEIDPARIALVGHSEGGLIAPLVALQDPRIRAIALMAPPGWTGRRILNYQVRYMSAAGDSTLRGARLDSAVARQMASIDSATAGSPWLRYFVDHDPLVTARKVRTPVLILQGATDKQVDPAQIAPLADAFRAGGNRSVTVRMFPDRDHLFLRDPSGYPGGYAALPKHTIDSDVMGALADWMVQQLGGK